MSFISVGLSFTRLFYSFCPVPLRAHPHSSRPAAARVHRCLQRPLRPDRAGARRGRARAAVVGQEAHHQPVLQRVLQVPRGLRAAARQAADLPPVRLRQVLPTQRHRRGGDRPGQGGRQQQRGDVVRHPEAQEGQDTRG